MSTPPDPQWQGEQPTPAPGDYPPALQGGYPPPPPAGYPPPVDQPGPGYPQSQFAAPVGVPQAVQNAFLCWTTLAGLVLVSFVINLAMSIGSGGTASGFLSVALAAGAAYGVREMRAGKRSGRVVAAVTGGVLGLLLLLSLVFILSVASGGAAVVNILFVALALGLAIAGMVFMFKSEVNAFLGR